MGEETKSRLGRGLAALIGDVGGADVERAEQRPTKAAIEFLRPNPRNPRQAFKEDDLRDLAESIRERGIVQPIVVRELSGVSNVYEIIAGERRWRAAQIAGLHEVPVVVVEADERQSLELAIIENVQRADLNAIEEAQGYQQLISEFEYSQQDLAKIIGKSRSQVTNTLRLLKLPAQAKQFVVDGLISAGHARALLSVPDPEQVARKIVEEDLTVRDVERLAQTKETGAETPTRTVKEKDADTLALEKSLTDSLGLSVKIDHRNEAGQVKILYQSMEQLDSLCKRLQG
ncbi:ParB/RepB/Spo0J family partition protein [Rhodoblastus acidophilus]|uniref:ParB/RepB/Spo0J family partition protein n=1 Tax=Candidatus Rhodoblastus alkanivorans TaxID=2954117 RepID=A0ABS9Z1X5_9HYPH|nr:ParB/RepB/Spo0J family partition protein [Candidatus Rhodoblastus alkanivorans]MCI4679939.1 ParB/RepB/Spo0J family partition protein [Candidatus Rhodoblastus alkanivorans]MCI4681486.1 ParB/RepB/Spo0J family partition protein [Candidatus Rhodoblastus alkanivorans]MDI4642534.1 ParB/RepB/Spo0J family partition protein [Rhodoblastus acidophilus]